MASYPSPLIESVLLNIFTIAPDFAGKVEGGISFFLVNTN